MVTAILIFVIAAFVCAVISTFYSPMPLWVAVILLCVVELLQVVPR